MKSDEALLSIPPDSASIATARRFTAAFLRNRELTDLIDTVVLLVSEVVTNAILHSGSGADLRLLSSGGAVRAEVRDRSSVLPAVVQYSDTATTGRGMLIVESLATEWGTEVDGKGKVVWFSVDIASYVTKPGHSESSALTAQRFASKENSRHANRPVVWEEFVDGPPSGLFPAGAAC
ncbi:MAG: ATP-binding protein [Actinomycetota bacterium]